jgi:MFS family permease
MPALIRKLRVDAFQSLRYRDFRFLWGGTLLGATGQWIQIATLSWIIYDMTGSGTLLGLLNGMRFFAFFLFTPYAGVAADRMDRRALMLITQRTSWARR